MSTATLRPLSTGEILDGAFVLYRRNLPLLLVVGAPSLLLELAAPFFRGAAATVLYIAAILVALAANAVLVHLLSQAYTTGRCGARESLRVVGRRLPSLLATSLVWAVLYIGGLLFLVLPGLGLGMLYFAMVPAAVIEGVGTRAARRRSRELVKGAEWQVFGVICITTLLYFLPRAAELLFASASASPVVEIAGSVWGMLLAPPLTHAVYVLLYYDRRMRAEGLDVTLAAARLNAA
jgi:hypothetical protein